MDRCLIICVVLLILDLKALGKGFWILNSNKCGKSITTDYIIYILLEKADVW